MYVSPLKKTINRKFALEKNRGTRVDDQSKCRAESGAFSDFSFQHVDGPQWIIRANNSHIWWIYRSKNSNTDQRYDVESR